MRKNPLDTLLQRFAIAAAAHAAALESMDAERSNRHVRMLGALHQSIMAAGGAGKEKFLSLFDHPDPVVAGMAAVYLISSDSDLSLATLQRVAREPGLLGFRAAAAIDRWNKGEWESVS